MAKKAVVTGGAGFIGSNIMDALLERGYEVLVVDDFSSGREDNLVWANENHAGKFEILKKDICDSSLAEDFKKFGPEIVFHTAAQIDVRKSVSDPGFDAQKNVEGTVNILGAAKEAGAGKFVFSSTGGAIYGEQDSFPADESHATKPESPYGVGKRAAELYMEYYARKQGMTCVSLRYSNVFGPRQNPHGEAGVVAIFTDRLLKGEELRVNGDGKQTRDFVFVKDVVAANLHASEIDEPGSFHIFNVGRGVERTVLDIVTVLEKIWPEYGNGNELKVNNGPALPGEQMRSVIDASKLKKRFSWSADTDLEAGLVETIKSFVS